MGYGVESYPQYSSSRTTDGGVSWSTTLIHRESFWLDQMRAIRLRGSTAIAVGDTGHMYYSTDFGESWSGANSGTRDRLFEIGFVDDSTVLAVGINGTVIRSMDGGKNWTTVDSFTYRSLWGIWPFSNSRWTVIAPS